MQQWLIGVVVSLFIVTVSAGVAQLGGDGGQQFRGLSVFVWWDFCVCSSVDIVHSRLVHSQ